MAKQKYLSVFSPQEEWADNRDVYRNILLENSSGIICNRSEAIEKLLFYERFDPKKPHDRTVAQIVKVVSLKNTDLYRKESEYGNIEQIVEIDFGQVAKQISSGLKPDNAKSNEYLDVQSEPWSFGKGRISIVNIKLLPCNYGRPILFGVLNYIAIDGERIKENYFIHRPVFNKKTHAFVEYMCHADNKLKLFELR